MESIARSSPRDKKETFYLSDQDRLHTRGSISNRQKPRGIYPFQETLEFDPDFTNTDDVHEVVSWPMPDHYERKPDPNTLTLQHDCKDEIEAAKQIVAGDESASSPLSGGYNRPDEESSTAGENVLHEDQLYNNYTAADVAYLARKGKKLACDSHDGLGPRLSTVTESCSATRPPVSRSRRYIVDDDEFGQLSELPSPDSFIGKTSKTMRTYVSGDLDGVYGSSGSTARPPTVFRVTQSPFSTATPYVRQANNAGRSDRPLPFEEKLCSTTTPALDRINRFENGGKSSNKGKDTNHLSQHGKSYGIEKGQIINHNDLFSRRNNFSLDIPDHSRSSREKAMSSNAAWESSHHSSQPSEGSNKPPDFFSQAIFQVVLHNPATSHQLLKYCQSQYCSENVEFLQKVEQYRTYVNHLAGIIAGIHQSFISDQSQHQVNVSGEIVDEVHNSMKSLVKDGLPAMEALFEPMQEKIEQLVFTDIYPRFVRHQIAMETTKSLSNNRHKYQGLGDCFCFSNPRLADNPVVYASDGFVKVTGYDRSEIIPRNCRFLQGPQTDLAAVRRIKNALAEERETVELLLNYKKDGSPFWNLLYMVPLCDATGKVTFFLGAQINCSTAIHSNTDVMRVLSASDQEATTWDMIRQSDTPKKKSILSAFRIDNHNRPPPPNKITGAEHKLLVRMEGRDLKGQIAEFYSVYSKFMIVRADTFKIEHYSSDITEALFLAQHGPGVADGCPVWGQDIFKFLKQYQLTTHRQGLKTSVKKAVNCGYPISTSVRLQTRRSAVFRGDENFAIHWTPLKNEHGATHWVVAILVPMMDPKSI